MTKVYESPNLVSGPYVGVAAVSPNNSAELPDGVTRGIYVDAAGNVNCVFMDGTEAVIYIPARTIVPFRLRQIKATSTAATGILALY